MIKKLTALVILLALTFCQIPAYAAFLSILLLNQSAHGLDLKGALNENHSISLTFDKAAIKKSRPVSQKKAAWTAVGGAAGNVTLFAAGETVLRGAFGSSRARLSEVLHDMVHDRRTRALTAVTTLGMAGIMYASSLADQKIGKGVAGYFAGTGTAAVFGAMSLPLVFRMAGHRSGLGFAAFLGGLAGALVAASVLGAAWILNKYS